MRRAPAKRRLVLAIGVAAWCGAVALTPGEIAAAKRNEHVSPRTIAALTLYLGAAILVLTGLAPPARARSEAREARAPSEPA